MVQRGPGEVEPCLLERREGLANLWIVGTLRA